MIATAKVFKNGASQAVRLPMEFRFAGEEVCVKRIGSAVLLFARGTGWDLMGEAIGAVDEDFMADRGQPMQTQKRKSLSDRRSRRAS